MLDWQSNGIQLSYHFITYNVVILPFDVSSILSHLM